MVVKHRIQYVRKLLMMGAKINVSISTNPSSLVQKYKVVIDPSIFVEPNRQFCVCHILDTIDGLCEWANVIDKGHQHTNGCSEVVFLVTPRKAPNQHNETDSHQTAGVTPHVFASDVSGLASDEVVSVQSTHLHHGDGRVTSTAGADQNASSTAELPERNPVVDDVEGLPLEMLQARSEDDSLGNMHDRDYDDEQEVVERALVRTIQNLEGITREHLSKLREAISSWPPLADMTEDEAMEAFQGIMQDNLKDTWPSWLSASEIARAKVAVRHVVASVLADWKAQLTDG
eukprot:gnl/TRDRNA2_/TRDRNA2_132527_c0_seq1.p1 gnl/TRDRNA2_/TRDRNA2_132527_c0~~gnl/TRDRNA2_/TRDRNA2_132527_c0_seq1.p1  ORF type:complete len:288 (-),score=37.31 gnl/TRDRNA2_/TRDRNA2_132527_c0_seq1:114-977(-)